MFRFIKNLKSLFCYIAILIYYDALFFCSKIPILNIFIFPLRVFSVLHKKKSNGERLCIAFHRMGPTFIKLGQFLSVRSDLVGNKIANDLTKLQDDLPAAKFYKINKILEREFKDNIDHKFLEFNKTAISVASIAEVFKAKTHDNKQVAVKVLRPKIKQKFKRDIHFLFFIAKIANLFPYLKRLRLIDVITTFEHVSNQELDLRYEAASADQLAENLKYNKNIHIPKIYWDLSSERVMVMEWIDGIKINQKNKLTAGKHNLKQISEKLLLCYFDMAYRDGFFHADLHPGNILITKDSKIALLDFGIMGNLSRDDRIYVTKILDGFIRRDYNYIAQIHHDAGYIPSSTDINDFALACRAIGEPLFGLPFEKISIAKLLELLFKITENYGMETQPQLLLLQKTLLTIEGVVRNLDDKVNMWDLGKPWMEEWSKENMGAKAHLKDFTNKSEKIIHKLPQIIEDLSDLLETRKNKQAYLVNKISTYKVAFIAAIFGAVISKLLF
ncbi:MAG: 2-polyprenylphenol 6-hydroxylase [Rickettsiales bacterium]|jgi:ubiquinone biosynthesis protein|nr:2-polyprenylphenol 6-hydroxylase [Rickettsiales bacterium]